MMKNNLFDLTDSEYLFDLEQRYLEMNTEESKKHAERLNSIRSRYETLERQMAFHFKHTAFTTKYDHKFTLAEPSREKLSMNHHSPIPMPHIVGKTRDKY